MDKPIRIGISACLLGQEVRFNGGHSRDRFLTDTLANFVEFAPVCPEVEAGFPIPRETFRLEGNPDNPRFVTSRSKADHTERMEGFCRRRVEELASEDLCGFIFKKDSPSSGMERVKVHGEKGPPVKRGVGLFARAFMKRFPLLPVEEEGRLHDPALRENFIEAIFVMRRWRDLLEGGLSRCRLVEFHTRHKLLIRSHSVEVHGEMGKLVAGAKRLDPTELRALYLELLMRALKLRPTVRKHSDVLMHAMGYFKKRLSPDEKQELLEVITHYRMGLTPLIVPITLLNHHVRKYAEPYLARQHYLNPHPIELKLRNHA